MLGNAKRERRLLEKTYDGKMTAYTFHEEKVNGETVPAKKMHCADKPCALSKQSDPETSKTEDAGAINYTAKLFCAPELDIPPGCEITITQYGKTTSFAYSGEAIRYPTHQELTVKRIGLA